jgi:hypothetical protein
MSRSWTCTARWCGATLIVPSGVNTSEHVSGEMPWLCPTVATTITESQLSLSCTEASPEPSPNTAEGLIEESVPSLWANRLSAACVTGFQTSADRFAADGARRARPPAPACPT